MQMSTDSFEDVPHTLPSISRWRRETDDCWLDRYCWEGDSMKIDIAQERPFPRLPGLILPAKLRSCFVMRVNAGASIKGRGYHSSPIQYSIKRNRSLYIRKIIPSSLGRWSNTHTTTANLFLSEQVDQIRHLSSSTTLEATGGEPKYTQSGLNITVSRWTL